MVRPRLVLALAAVFTLLGCNKEPPKEAAPAGESTSEPDKGEKGEKEGKEAKEGKGHEPKSKKAKGEKDEGKEAKEARADKDGKDAHEAGDGKRFALPFAWEASEDEPLSVARKYLQSLKADNDAYAKKHDAAFFKAFADTQKPRATVVTCSDSRVQSPAFDATPENDDFTIRNIGNQLENSEGSVDYGVMHLKTPVLLVLGHTGCGAVKAAMGDFSKEPEPIRRELDPLKVPKRSGKETGDFNEAWAEAVIANVNDQVERALKKFEGPLVAGRLTVVGAVYDFRNDLKKGAGKVVIVNVNGNTEPARVAAFERALGAPPDDAKGGGLKKDDGAVAAFVAKVAALEADDGKEHAKDSKDEAGKEAEAPKEAAKEGGKEGAKEGKETKEREGKAGATRARR